MAERLDVALLGFGNVGQALAQQLAEGAYPVRVTSITDRSGTLVDRSGLDLAAALAAKTEHERVTAAPGQAEAWTTREAARQAPADVLVQLTPSDLADPERGLAELTAGLEAGRSVVTAAKDALARRPEQVQQALEASGGRLRCNASVGGSTPVLELLEGAFAGDELDHLTGVLNGSTTAMLSRMQAGESYGQALDEARSAGLLEADAKADLLGLDPGAKAAILHQRIFGSTLSLDAIPIEGITDVDPADCRRADQQGFAVRLVARVDEEGARVRPVDLPKDSPLVTSGPRAAVRLVFQRAGEIVVRGPGAGPAETAATVLSDVLATHRTRKDRATASPGGSPVAVREAGW